jgi:glutaconate CoA-transferase subunit B
VDEARATIGWDVHVAESVADTAPPTADELRLIRDELDPGGAYTK